MRVERELVEDRVGGSTLVSEMLEALRGVRAFLERGWLRDRSRETNYRDGITRFCVTGAAFEYVSGNTGRYQWLLSGLAKGLPEGYEPPTYTGTKPMPPDDSGYHWGTSRGGSDAGSRLASFNNLAPDKEAVLNLVDRAIVAEKIRLMGEVGDPR